MVMHKAQMIENKNKITGKILRLSQYQQVGLCSLFVLIGSLCSGIANAGQSVDSDGDGLPDSYENNYAFLNPLNTADAALDQDGDGYSNLEEYIVGTNPDSVASKPGDVLLIDDDIPLLSALSSYTAVLNQLGVTYDVISTDATDVAAALAAHRAYPNIYNKIIWFGESGTGPNQAAETALAATLDVGRCVIISSYYLHADYSERVTAFMSNYLGVASMAGDVPSFSISGAGRFSGLGSYSLAGLSVFYNDTITPDSTAFVGFTGAGAGAAIFKDSGAYRTGFLGFSLEAVADVNDRAAIVEALLDYCDTGHLPPSDFDGDGNPDVTDLDDDNDGIPDAYENKYAFLNPLNASDASADQDGDGLTNQQEYQFGSELAKRDTDQDGLSDKYEFDNSLDPTDGICPPWVCGGTGGWRHVVRGR